MHIRKDMNINTLDEKDVLSKLKSIYCKVLHTVKRLICFRGKYRIHIL